jgi:hypothetical protein
MHYFGKHLSSEEEDLSVTWWVRRLKKSVTGRKYWVHTHFIQTGNPGFVARE